MLDLLIRGAQVYDGLGAEAVLADVGVENGQVQKVGRINEPARQTVNAEGLSLMPGIVDLHTHFDAQVTWDPTLDRKSTRLNSSHSQQSRMPSSA